MENEEKPVCDVEKVKTNSEEVHNGRRKAINQIAYASPVIASLLFSKTVAAQASRFSPPPPPQ